MRGLILAAIILLGLAGAVSVNPAGVADVVRGRGYDLLQTITPRPVEGTPSSERPLLVEFDTDAALPNWLDLAVLVRRLDAAGAKAVVLPEPLSRPDPMSPEQIAAAWMDAGLGLELRDSLAALTPHRQILAEAVSGRPVIGVFDTAAAPASAVAESAMTISADGNLSTRLPASPGARGNLADLEKAMKGLGDAALRPDADNVVRSVPLATDVAGRPVASVLLRALSLPAEDAPQFRLGERALPDLPLDLPNLKQDLVFSSGESGPTVPADAYGRYRLYKARAGDLPRVSADAVLAGRMPPESVQGRLAVIGGIPFNAPEYDVGSGERWSRAQILTNALDQIAAGQHVQRMSWADMGETIIMVLLGLILLGLAALPSTVLPVLFTLIAVGGLWTGSLYALTEYGLWFDAAVPSAGILATALLALMFRPRPAARAEDEEAGEPAERREPGLPPIMPALRRTQGDTAIRAGRGTLFVCSIRRVEELERIYADAPERLAEVLKTFRRMAAKHIESQGGTVLPEDTVGAPGKIAGLWQLDGDRNQAARQVADCALRLVAGLDDFNETLEDSLSSGGKQGKAGDAPPLPEVPELDVSIGIASGPVFVQPGGQGGAPDRVFGAAVASADLLAASAADYGPAILMGGKAADSVRSRYALLEVDLLDLPRADGEAMPVYALMGNPLVRANPRFRTLDEAHQAIFQAYRERKWPMARALVDQCRKLSMAVPGLYDLYEKRIAYFEQNPPDENWTGAFRPPVR